MIAIGFVVGVIAGTLGIGVWGVRLARTTSDLYVASRAISPWWNAAAISGEYLSAASFLAIAGLTMRIGGAALWLPLGFAAGYLSLLLFVAAPLRRYGSYTISDFAEARLEAPWMRGLAATIVLGIGVLYLVPQLKGAGISVQAVTGAPYWVGVLAIGAVVALAVGLGGMRGVTYVQAYQFWVKMFAIAAPIAVLLVVLHGFPGRATLLGSEYPSAPRGGLSLDVSQPERVVFPQATAYSVDGRPGRAGEGETVTLPAGRLRLPAGVAVPVAAGADAQRGSQWARPVTRGGESSRPLYVYSLLIATVLGTMGLPHILVRFYTNPDGPATRRTTVHVLGLLAVFYAFPALYGALGRVLAPGLYVTGETDTVVLRLPELAWPGLGGQLLGAITAAGAFAAFMSTSSGLLVSIAGTISYDVWPRLRGLRGRGGTDRRRRFRLAAFGGIVVPVALGLAAREIDISVLVGWAFALAASTFCPMFLLGIWWGGLTARGAAMGMSVGAVLATAGIAIDLTTGDLGGALGALLAQPALLSVPVAFLVMVVASRLDRRGRIDATPHMLALHVPEGLGLEAFEREPSSVAATTRAR